MKIKCDYCGAYINDTDEVCENCGAHNQHLVRNAKAAPKTIEELKDWYVAHNLPDENVTRFFIGKDYKGARAFGIYKDELSGNYIVYKNKDTGVRAVRYEGKDEAYAVNELYLKLKEEIVNQKRINVERRNNANRNYKYSNPDKSSLMQFLIVMFVILIGVFISSMAYMDSLTPNRGYYKYGSDYYYYQAGYWYMYNNSDWEKATPPADLSENYDTHYESSYYSSSYNIDDFADSSYYVAPSTSDSDSSWDSWDSGSSWDSSDSWDSGSTDWGSDWLKIIVKAI